MSFLTTIQQYLKCPVLVPLFDLAFDTAADLTLRGLYTEILTPALIITDLNHLHIVSFAIGP